MRIIFDLFIWYFVDLILLFLLSGFYIMILYVFAIELKDSTAIFFFIVALVIEINFTFFILCFKIWLKEFKILVSQTFKPFRHPDLKRAFSDHTNACLTLGSKPRHVANGRFGVVCYTTRYPCSRILLI